MQRNGDAKEGSLKARLNVRCSQMMKKITEELGVKYKQNGSLVIPSVVINVVNDKGECGV